MEVYALPIVLAIIALVSTPIPRRDAKQKPEYETLDKNSAVKLMLSKP